MASAGVTDDGTKKDGECVRCLKESTTELDPLNSETGILFYPNPVNNLLHIMDINGSNAIANIYNLQGKELLKIHVTPELLIFRPFRKALTR